MLIVIIIITHYIMHKLDFLCNLKINEEKKNKKDLFTTSKPIRIFVYEMIYNHHD